MTTFRTRSINFVFYGDGVDTQVSANITHDLESGSPPTPQVSLLQVTSVVNGTTITLTSSYSAGILNITLPTAPGTYNSGAYVLVTATFTY